jgi:small subunit ribosomal protein S17
MAENPEETPENIVEEVEAQAAPDEGAAEAEATTEEPTAEESADEAPAAEAPSRKERNAAARKAKAKTVDAPRTLEERLAERKAHRAANAASRTRYRAKLKAKRAEARASAGAGETASEQHAPEHGPGRPKVRQGVVVSDKGDKTIVVRIDMARRHRRYQKILRSSTTLHVHDERNDAHAGDTVRVMECRPMSKTKRWRLTEVLERAR